MHTLLYLYFRHVNENVLLYVFNAHTNGVCMGKRSRWEEDWELPYLNDLCDSLTNIQLLFNIQPINVEYNYILDGLLQCAQYFWCSSLAHMPRALADSLRYTQAKYLG